MTLIFIMILTFYILFSFGILGPCHLGKDCPSQCCPVPKSLAMSTPLICKTTNHS